MDQSRGLCYSGWRIRHRAARPGSRAGHLADRSRRSVNTFRLRSARRLEFRSEFFNIFNHPQLGLPQSTFNPSNTTGFGSIINTVNTATPMTPVGSGTPREIQFALRLDF